MTTIQVQLHDGKSYTFAVENYDEIELTEKLNNNQNTVVNIGKIIVSRSAVKAVLPIATEEPTA